MKISKNTKVGTYLLQMVRLWPILPIVLERKWNPRPSDSPYIWLNKASYLQLQNKDYFKAFYLFLEHSP